MLCGADLVLELPVSWACAGAQRFAAGGVGLLSSSGVVSHIAFGSESANLDAITAAAQLTDDQAVNARIRAFLASGMGYAAARERAVREADPTAGATLASPNDILGVEYVRAILRHGYPLTPLPIPRHGASHDGAPAGRFASPPTSAACCAPEGKTRLLCFCPTRRSVFSIGAGRRTRAGRSRRA